MAIESIEQRVDVLRETIVALVRRDGPDLSARQLGVFLTCYREDEAQTVRGLAAKLAVSKPAITRALDRLSEFDLVRRKTDPLDRRSVLVQRTVAGNGFMRDLKTILANAGKEVDKVPSRVGALVRASRGSDRTSVLAGSRPSCPSRMSPLHGLPAHHDQCVLDRHRGVG
jgi:DNA-binding MarR family transcriptional regulator